LIFWTCRKTSGHHAAAGLAGCFKHNAKGRRGFAFILDPPAAQFCAEGRIIQTNIDEPPQPKLAVEQCNPFNMTVRSPSAPSVSPTTQNLTETRFLPGDDLARVVRHAPLAAIDSVNP
jgi:hypothetical protein